MSNALLQSPIAALIGVLAGTHAAIWGMYKDSIHEGFKTKSFFRSIVLGGFAATAIQTVLRLPLPHPSSLVLLFGLAYALERGAVEVWKTFVRQEDQSKYFIPMQFSVRGVPVTSPWLRVFAGAAYVSALVAALLGISRIDAALTAPPLARAALIGIGVGVIVAIGGCWKDAPKEGFDLLKFFRSPLMTLFYAMALAMICHSAVQIAVAAVGFERATVETYKKFFFPTKAPGKFRGMPMLYPDMFVRRRYFVPIYVAISTSAAAYLLLAIQLAAV
jgi:hypothetical protein